MRLDDEATWQADVLDCLRRHEDIFDDWDGPAAQARERARSIGAATAAHSFPGPAYDRAVQTLEWTLRRHTLDGGHHCSRLTTTEIDAIRIGGMRLQDGVTLAARISALERTGEISAYIAARLAKENQADDENRANKIWFVFFEPHLAGQEGIERLFRSWGGESLYNSHERDAVTGPILRRIGTPCVITANVPIASLQPTSWLSVKLIRRYFANRGASIADLDHEDFAVRDIPANAIVGITPFTDSRFIHLTRCDRWDPGLS